MTHGRKERRGAGVGMSEPSNTAYRYDGRFLDYAANTSAVSARKVIAVLRAVGPIDSVLDVGCARGTWLQEWSRAGASEILGVDGAYADNESLLIDRARFMAADLAAGFDLGRQFDLVQSLEVAEHLPASASAGFVACLVRHSRGWCCSPPPRPAKAASTMSTSSLTISGEAIFALAAIARWTGSVRGSPGTRRSRFGIATTSCST